MSDRTRMPEPALAIPSEILRAMVEHCIRESPLECCGILGGDPPRVAAIYPLRNAEASETRFNADPRDLIDAHQQIRARGQQLAAIYHSHPRWAAVPSRTDLERNGYGDLPQIIVSLLGGRPEVRAWRLGRDSYEELAWSEVPPPPEDPAPLDVDRPRPAD